MITDDDTHIITYEKIRSIITDRSIGKMNDDDNSWYATICGNSLKDINNKPLSVIREEKLKKLTKSNFRKKIENILKRLGIL